MEYRLLWPATFIKRLLPGLNRVDSFAPSIGHQRAICISSSAYSCPNDLLAAAAAPVTDGADLETNSGREAEDMA